MTDESTWWSDAVGSTQRLYDDPWTSVFPYRPWMRELHRPGQEVAFLRSSGGHINEWQPTARVFQLQCAIGTARYLAVRRDGQETLIELDKPIVFSGGDFQSVWQR